MEQQRSTIDYNYFINASSARRRPALTRQLTKLVLSAPRNWISLAEGMPNEVTFPFQSMEVTLKDGSSFCLQGPELASGLQYNASNGCPAFREKLKEFTKHLHGPPNWANTEVLVTSGTQDAISKSFSMCLEEGDAIVVQDPTYAGVDSAIKPFAAKLLGVKQDGEGMIPELLRQVLEDWKQKCNENPELAMPKLMYINPTGNNPTGTTTTEKRRTQIYKICCEYNLLILEDDPYYFLHFNESLTKSFLSIDTEGRVLRFDSMSKCLCPGLRIGWITGPTALIAHLELHVESSYLLASTLTQMITLNLLSTWSMDQFMDHTENIRQYYRARRDYTLAAMEKNLKGLAEWNIPQGGLFVWIKVIGVSDVYEMLITRAQKKMVTFVPGHSYMTDPTAACPYIRASYSRAPLKQIDKAMKLLAELIKEERLLINKKLDDCV